MLPPGYPPRLVRAGRQELRPGHDLPVVPSARHQGAGVLLKTQVLGSRAGAPESRRPGAGPGALPFFRHSRRI